MKEITSRSFMKSFQVRESARLVIIAMKRWAEGVTVALDPDDAKLAGSAIEYIVALEVKSPSRPKEGKSPEGQGFVLGGFRHPVPHCALKACWQIRTRESKPGSSRRPTACLCGR